MTASPPVTGERVLVVDDEADIVALVAYHLAKSGYRVSTAGSGPDALDAEIGRMERMKTDAADQLKQLRDLRRKVR